MMDRNDWPKGRLLPYLNFETKLIMTNLLKPMIISGCVFSVFAIVPAIAPARADNVVATEPADFVTAGGTNCPNGEIMDGSTAEQTRQRIEAVGYTDVTILEKGCDNVWHATGIKGGESRNLIVSPDGGVLPGKY